jgi:hypothetical protein
LTNLIHLQFTDPPSNSQHRVSPFALIDPTKPGHRRFIALWLVDPTKRIISTANVPPQQADWYTESLFGTASSSYPRALAKFPAEILTLLREKGLTPDDAVASGGAKLPEELLDMVRGWVDADGDGMKFPMSLEEAEEHRRRLMAERSVIQVATETCWRQWAYGFCEH